MLFLAFIYLSDYLVHLLQIQSLDHISFLDCLLDLPAFAALPLSLLIASLPLILRLCLFRSCFLNRFNSVLALEQLLVAPLHLILDPSDVPLHHAQLLERTLVAELWRLELHLVLLHDWVLLSIEICSTLAHFN